MHHNLVRLHRIRDYDASSFQCKIIEYNVLSAMMQKLAA